MMTISLSDAGKRYNREWIFRHFNQTFESGRAYAITGPNGSGKSTLLQILGGVMDLNEGKCSWSLESKSISTEKIFQHISISAPYLELIEEMTVNEFWDFHHGFKKPLPGINREEIIAMMGLDNARNKQIRYFSSGMKQRLKLAQCIFSDTQILLLDEPCTNLDHQGIELYQKLIETYTKNRLTFISSNDEIEYRFCQERVHLPDLKS